MNRLRRFEPRIGIDTDDHALGWNAMGWMGWIPPGWNRSRLGSLTWLLLLIGAVTPALADHETVREGLPAAWRETAELTDVFFLDSQHGWAVGAQGTIIRTEDGGGTWSRISQLQDFRKDEMLLEQKVRDLQAGRLTATTGVTNRASQFRPIQCRFESVHFIDARHGWVAGGYHLPYVDRSRAVVMHTRDGGKNWESIEGLMIPALKRIHFHSADTGWAVGDSGHLLSAGLYLTTNGGQSWSSDVSQRATGWRDAAPTPTGYVTIDHQGRLGRVFGDQFALAPLINVPAEPSFQTVRMFDDQEGIATGRGGLIVETKNGGQSWTRAGGPDSPAPATWLDVRACDRHDRRIWFAGEPGTQIGSMDLDTGQIRWTRTPVNTRLNQLCFVDDQRGWAVGELGIVLATRDGGASWQLQRGASKPMALMAFSPTDTDLPLGLLARYATEEDYLCGSLVLSNSDPAHDRARQATDRLGVAVHDQIQPSRASALPESADQALLAALVGKIRAWRPTVVVCHGTPQFDSPTALQGREPTAQLRRAIQMAADHRAFPEQIRDGGLATHRVSRLVTRDPIGPLAINPERLLARTGERTADRIALSRALLGRTVNPPENIRYRVVPEFEKYSMGKQELFSGLGSLPLPRRSDQPSRGGNLASIKLANQRARMLDEMAGFEMHRPEDIAVWRRKVEAFVSNLDRRVAGTWLMQLTERYQQQGQLELAAQSAGLLSTYWAESPYASACLVWLANYYASDEFGQLVLKDGVRQGRLKADGSPSQASRIASQFSTTPQRTVADGVTQLKWTPQPVDAGSLQSTSGEIDVPRDNEPEDDSHDRLADDRPELLTDRIRQAVRVLSAIDQRDPDLSRSPLHQWQEAQLTRRMAELAPGMTVDPANRFKTLMPGPSNPDSVVAATGRPFEIRQQVIAAARRELQLLAADEPRSNPGGESPPSATPHPGDPVRLAVSAEAVQTSQRPVLDGKLDETCWTAARSALTAAPTNRVLVAYDPEYLYLGIEMEKLPGVPYDWTPQPRPRDANLNGRDRVVLELDIDRDYQHAYRLVIDHRGWARESCGTVVQWDPTWYVSHSDSDRQWKIEAAIPLTELVGQRIAAGTVWAVSATRETGTQLESSASPFLMAVPRPEPFAWLAFPAAN